MLFWRITMLALTKRTEYALIAMHYMIDRGAVGQDASKAEPVSAREIAEKYGVPLALLMNILKKLAGEHVLVSLRGARGGYVLAADPKKLSLARLIEAVEGPVEMVECACERNAGAGIEEGEIFPCRIQQSCPIKRPLQMLHERLLEFLRKTSVYDLCAYRETAALGPLTQVGV